MGIQEYLQEATGKGASDLFIVAGLPLTYKINRKMIRVGDRLMPEDTVSNRRYLCDCTGKKDRNIREKWR